MVVGREWCKLVYNYPFFFQQENIYLQKQTNRFVLVIFMNNTSLIWLI